MLPVQMKASALLVDVKISEGKGSEGLSMN